MNPILAESYVQEILKNVDEDNNGFLDYSGNINNFLNFGRIYLGYHR